jgi:hypothetical protein
MISGFPWKSIHMCPSTMFFILYTDCCAHNKSSQFFVENHPDMLPDMKTQFSKYLLYISYLKHNTNCIMLTPVYVEEKEHV